MTLIAIKQRIWRLLAKNSRLERAAKLIAMRIRRYEHSLRDSVVYAIARQKKVSFADISSQIDINQYNNLSIRNWPPLKEVLESGDKTTAIARLLACIAECEKNNLLLHELGGIRLLSRITEGKVNDEKRQSYLVQRFGAIPLTKDYTLCANNEGSDFLLAEDENRYGNIYFEYDRRGSPEHVLENASFSIRGRNGKVALMASACIIKSGGIIGSSHTHPVIPIILSDDKAGVGGALAEALPLLQIVYGAKDILISEIDPEGLLFYRSLVRRRASFSAELYVYPYVDLNKPEEAIRSDMRKSSRSLVNWGSKTLTVADFSGPLLTDTLANDVYEFIEKHHAPQIAQQGANYMPRWSFDCTIDLCRANRGEISIAFNSSAEMVGVSVVIYEDCDVVYYKEGGYNHDIQGKSPAQFLVLHCIFRAKAKGFKVFKSNRLLPAPIYLEGHRIEEWESWRWANCDFKDGFSSTVISKLAYGFEGSSRVDLPPC